jgi:hypothetical protein
MIMISTMTHFLIALALAATAGISQHSHRGADAHGAMGFDQRKTTHHFWLETAGGTIEVTAKDASDRTAIDEVRMHLRHIASAFGQGDFNVPFLVHGTEPPGVVAMKARRASIEYRFDEVPRGGKVVVRTSDETAKSALHEFLRFQIRQHRTGDPLQPIRDAK